MKKDLKSSLKKLVYKYNRELSKGNFEHLKDLIAIYTIYNINPYRPGLVVVDDINLDKLIYAKTDKGDIKEFRVPPLEMLNNISNACEERLREWRYFQTIGDNEENAAVKWLIMMIHTGMIKENQIIDPTKIALSDFITDDELKGLYDSQNLLFNYYKEYIKKRK